MKAEPNDNLVSCEAPTAPVDNDDSTPFDDFVKWYLHVSMSAPSPCLSLSLRYKHSTKHIT